MSDKGNIILIIVALTMIIIGGFFTFFEISNIPDVKWNKSYNLDSDDPYDASLFKKLLQSKFGSENIVLRNEGYHFKNNQDSTTLYIYIGNKRYYKNTLKDSLIHFASKGNNVLLISPTHSFYKPNAEELDSDENFHNIYQDLEQNDTLHAVKVDSINPTENVSKHVIADLILDSLIQLKFTTQDTVIYHYKNYYHDFKTAKLNEFSYVSSKDSCTFQPYITDGNDKIWYGNYTEIPNIDLHFVPELFSNAAARQNSYLKHFNYVFDKYKISKVVIDNPSMQPDFIADNNNSPLTYIIKTPTLKWAYFITIITFLIYITNGGKRKQKVIPLIAQPKNTTLEYIKMISKLYEEQEQNEKLVLHMRKNFNHFINKKYFVELENIDALSKKSGIDKETIERILIKFEHAQKRNFSDEQLFVLHNQIESFIKNCN